VTVEVVVTVADSTTVVGSVRVEASVTVFDERAPVARRVAKTNPAPITIPTTSKAAPVV
jgi:hypothetical protein